MSLAREERSWWKLFGTRSHFYFTCFQFSCLCSHPLQWSHSQNCANHSYIYALSSICTSSHILYADTDIITGKAQTQCAAFWYHSMWLYFIFILYDILWHAKDNRQLITKTRLLLKDFSLDFSCLEFEHGTVKGWIALQNLKLFETEAAFKSNLAFE